VNWRISQRVSLRNERISRGDADRQRRTAAEILRRFDRQPGVVLADEVGLGKTYVALAVAASVASRPKHRGPVVVMVPPSVGQKWPREWETFQEKCLRSGPELRATKETLRSGSEFLKLLDDPDRSASHIVFVTHGALTTSLADPLVRFAIVRQALMRRSLRNQRQAFPRWATRVIPGGWSLREDLATALMESPPKAWRREWARATGRQLADDPVPTMLVRALRQVDLSTLTDACRELPLRTSSNLEARLGAVRRELNRAVEAVWQRAFRAAKLHLPLLVLDEAHHAKNPRTDLASLFAGAEARHEAELLGGALAGVFDRMLFLTATPLQLASSELIEVLRRFEGTRWGDLDHDVYRQQIERLERALNAMQSASLRLDRAWNALTPDDVNAAPPRWWDASHTDKLPGSLSDIYRHVCEVRVRSEAAERLVRPFVIRHARPNRESRRDTRCGRAIIDLDDSGVGGLQVSGSATLPFLLAARAQALVLNDDRRPDVRRRAFFAEGLASSFEAYVHTRQVLDSEEAVDEMSVVASDGFSTETRWYLDQIRRALPEREFALWAEHPKIAATVKRATELWSTDEKVLVFCFYRATGRALRDHITRAIDREIVKEAKAQLGTRRSEQAVRDEVRRRSERFFDPDAPVTRLARDRVRKSLTGSVEPEKLDEWIAVVLRFLRTPSFLVRRVGIRNGSGAGALERAFDEPDRAGRTLQERLTSLADFLANRLSSEREDLLSDLQLLESGVRVRKGELQLPNVRLANGDVDRKIRARLLSAFNTPFFPDVLIASSVMAEGVDLQLNCRHVIHHDLDWNPSVIEQRTGRLDRLGSLAEQTTLPVVVFEPFLEATQDEKMFRVMKDRERWFNIVMGQGLELDEWNTERLSLRVPLPDELSRQLTLNLAYVRTNATTSAP
jgi:ERCC4-related helicase